MKTVDTTVTPRQIAEVQGGDPTTYTDTYTVTVRCPDSYDPALITAADIVHDGQITVTDR